MDLTRSEYRLIQADLLDRIRDMSDLDLAFAYVDNLDYELSFEYGFIEEMTRRGLSFADLEQMIINYYNH